MSCNFRLLPRRRVVAAMASCEGGGEGGDAVGGGGVEVTAVAAPAGEGCLGVCRHPETTWYRLAALAPCSETLFVQSTAGSLVNSQTCPA